MPYLIDKSALARMPHPAVRARLVPILEGGEAATCAVIDLEVLYSTRNASDHARTRRRRALAYRHVELAEATFQRAIDVLVLLHYDADFDRIASVTGQPMEWVVARGSV